MTSSAEADRSEAWLTGLAAVLGTDPAALTPDARLFRDVDIDVARLDVFLVESFAQQLVPTFAFQGIDHIRWVTVADLAYYCGVTLGDPERTTS